MIPPWTFAQSVRIFLYTYGDNAEMQLATTFEVATSTVWRWVYGIAVPHPRIQKLILSWIEDYTNKLRKAGNA